MAKDDANLNHGLQAAVPRSSDSDGGHMKRGMFVALVLVGLLLTPVASSAQTWVPFGTAYWLAAAGESGGYGLVTDSETCVVGEGCPWGTTYGGLELNGGPTDPSAVTALSFAYKADTTGSGGGSPRLVLEFSDGGSADLRPLNWTADVWVTVDGLGFTPTWDNNGGSCGYRYNVTWADILDCHSGTTITSIYLVNDSGWLYPTSGEQVVLDAVNVNGIGFGPDKDTCKKGGFVALGFKNQGECVASFVSKRR
jgi:hypothetical protein